MDWKLGLDENSLLICWNKYIRDEPFCQEIESK
jgi:hypothetical protein